MANENEPTQDLETPDTAPLIRQAIAEMIQTRELLSEQMGRLEQRFGQFEEEVRKELRIVAKRLDAVAAGLQRHGAEIEDLQERVTNLERKPA